jgi:DNA repair exonuclease SbcCD ATPase subunit
LSGGERARICLALNLALAKVIAKSSGTRLNWIALDEILNGLDEKGKSQTMKFLKELESEYETIFIVDHDESFKSMFTNSISIVKKSKISYIV